MATSFSLTSGTTWVNGMTANSTNLNDSVDLATFSSVTASIIIGFDGSSNACDVPYSFQISNGLNHNIGTSWHTTTRGITIGDNASSCMAVVGQSSSNALTVTWNYNGTTSNASATIDTFGSSNPINIKGSVLNLLPASGTTVTNGLTTDRQIAMTSALTYSSTTTIPFSTGTSYQTLAVSGGNLTLATSGLTNGARVSILILGDTVNRTLTTPSWIVMGAILPTTLFANKYAVLSLTSYGTSDATTVAAFAAQP